MCVSKPLVVYFSTKSGNTKRFVEKLDFDHLRIPLSNDGPLVVDRPFVLVTPTYGGGYIAGAVPRQVIKFLNVESNRQFIKGVISTGNRNFGEGFCLAGKVISQKCNVPNLASIELFGTPDDVISVNDKLSALFSTSLELLPS